jgi:hypothetical protein
MQFRKITKSDYYPFFFVCPSVHLCGTSRLPLDKTQLLKTVFNSCFFTYKVNFLMMVVTTNEICRFMYLLCENFGIIKCMMHICGNF